MMGAIKRIIGLLLGLLTIIFLFTYGMAHLYLLSNPTPPNFLMSVGALSFAFIIGLAIVKYLWSRLP